MMKFLSIVAALCLLLTVNSCKKCYECSDTCAYCQVSGTAGTTFCSSDGQSNYENYHDACVAAGGTWVKDASEEDEVEICDKPSDAEDEADEYEDDGYDCVSK